MSSLSGKQGQRYRHIAEESEPCETIAVEKLTLMGLLAPHPRRHAGDGEGGVAGVMRENPDRTTQTKKPRTMPGLSSWKREALVSTWRRPGRPS